ncbi:MAG: hypothetical protein E7438_00395 [Ruminococcaceae bacterium]|nr:hypothetical protein [Oscillospiraceae bacterium]
MKEQKAVDVISVCNTDGEILPLRLQLVDENKQLLRIHIRQARVTERIEHIGAEAVVFHCRAEACDRMLSFRLKYTYRSHIWHLL